MGRIWAWVNTKKFISGEEKLRKSENLAMYREYQDSQVRLENFIIFLSQDPFIFLKVLRTPKSGLYPFITM
jgi:hypothetical protein